MHRAGHTRNRASLGPRIAPAPILAGLEGSHDGVLRAMKVLSDVLIDRCIAAAHVAAGEHSVMRYTLGREPARFRPHPHRARDAGAEIACGL